MAQRLTNVLIAGVLVAVAVSCAAPDGEDISGAAQNATEQSNSVYTVSASNNDLSFKDFRDRKIDGSKMFNRGPLAAVGLERMPFVLFRILPELARSIDKKDTFGEPGKDFEPFGFFFDKRPGQADWPIPVGFTFTVQDARAASQVSYVIRTCASCHIGRARTGGKVQFLEGAPNTEMDFHAFTSAWDEFVARAFRPDSRAATKAEILRILQAKKASFFFNGQSSFQPDGQEVAFDDERAKEQVDIFIRDFDELAEEMFTTNEHLRGVNVSMKDAFHRAPDPSKAQSNEVGPRGILDSNSNGIYSILNTYNQKNPTAPFPMDTLYAGATKVSIPSIWQQDRRKAAQWTANVTNIFFRNAIAALGFGSAGKDLNGLHLSVVSKYISDLPAPKFPEGIDEHLANKGKAVYEGAKCGGCHVADHKDLTTADGFPRVFKMGTSSNRSRSSTPGVGKIVGGALWQTCAGNEGNKALAVTINGVEDKPCKVDPTKLTLPRDTEALTGYPAMPLDGLWARAPYLHNGSVPTLYHLLASKAGKSERPATFSVGKIDYDTKNIGFDWKPESPITPQGTYDTSLDGFANGGHEGAGSDGMWTDPATQTSFKLSWDVAVPAEKEQLLALLEYLKTL